MPCLFDPEIIYDNMQDYISMPAKTGTFRSETIQTAVSRAFQHGQKRFVLVRNISTCSHGQFFLTRAFVDPEYWQGVCKTGSLLYTGPIVTPERCEF